jgi:hypothetical protein
MRLGWTINRLRSMGPAEIGHRLVEKARQRRSRERHEGWARYPAPALHPVFPGLADRVRGADAAQREALRSAAERTLAGRFSALGRDWPARDPKNLFPPELWRLDPVSGQSWPGADAYSFAIDFRAPKGFGDVKYVWEINRLQFLPPLAAWLALEGDTRAADAIAAAIQSWHAANPPFRGLGWAAGIEVALRAISLILTLDLAGDRIPVETRQLAGEILAASAFWLPRFPSKFSSANNHRVAELAGECLIARALGRDPAAAEQALEAEIALQILPDGAPAEQSPTYGAFTAELALVAAVARGKPISGLLANRLAAFADYVNWLGPVTPAVGDNDEGYVIADGTFLDQLSPSAQDEGEAVQVASADYPRAISAAIAGALGRPGPAPVPGDFRTLLLATRTIETLPAPNPPVQLTSPQGLKTFAEGGLSVWHGQLANRAVDLVFDHGPLGYLSIAAHGHADALSVLLSLDGRAVLVDPGTFLYGSGGIWRDWFRGTPAHNTLNLAGQNQSRIAGPFNWAHKARSELLEAIPGPDWRLTARHDGYQLRLGVRHERSVAREGDAIAVTDRLRGGAREAEIVFQLAADLDAAAMDSTVTVRRAGTPLLVLTLPPGEIAITSGGDLPGQGGWVSPRFGLKLPAPRVAWRGEVGEAGVVTRLTPIPPPI